MSGYATVIGLEVHVQLDTRSKLFCACAVVDRAAPNSSVCPVCLGHPGAMPSLNAQAVHLALRAAVALGMQAHGVSAFDRKHYAYPDTPKGYQITQQRHPLATGGALHLRQEGAQHRHALLRLQLEEDSGKLQHASGHTLADWNRAGVPLIEIVGAPDVHSPMRAEAWLRMLHRVLVAAGVTRGRMEQGELRCDANISLAGGARVELKNLNSFRFVGRALRHEVQRQTEILDAGGTVVSETRTWTGKETQALRQKEGAADYRFLPEADLPSLHLSNQHVVDVMAAMPGQPPLDLHLLHEDDRVVQSWMHSYGLSKELVTVLTADTEVASFYAGCVEAGGPPLAMAEWVRQDVLRAMREQGVSLGETPLEPQHLVDLHDLHDRGVITRAVGRRVFDWVWRRGGYVEGLVMIQGLQRIQDPQALRDAVDRVLADHPEQADAWRSGNDALGKFLLGQTLQALNGRAEAADVQAALDQARTL